MTTLEELTPEERDEYNVAKQTVADTEAEWLAAQENYDRLVGTSALADASQVPGADVAQRRLHAADAAYKTALAELQRLTVEFGVQE